MDELEAIGERHSVRTYDNQALREQDAKILEEACAKASDLSGLTFTLVVDEREAFSAGLLHYGKIDGIANYIAIMGPKGKEADELAGYYGERLVLLAQTMDIKSCWAGAAYSKRRTKVDLKAGQRLIIAIALGYSEERGNPHRSRGFDEVATVKVPTAPAWFEAGVKAALLAPTAINQQKFHLTLTDRIGDGGLPVVELTARLGPFSHVDLGIVRYHFEVAAGRSNFVWA
jgi:nitroreductase